MKKMIKYLNINFELEDDVVLALRNKAFDEVYPIIRNDLPNEQLFLLGF